MASANAQTIALRNLPIPTDSGKGHVPAHNAPGLNTGESADTTHLSSARKTLIYGNPTAAYNQGVVHNTFVQTDTTIRCSSTSTGAQSCSAFSIYYADWMSDNDFPETKAEDKESAQQDLSTKRTC